MLESALAKKMKLKPGPRDCQCARPIQGDLSQRDVRGPGADLTRDKGWDSLTNSTLKWLTMISVDDSWSAFALRPYRPGEARQSFR